MGVSSESGGKRTLYSFFSKTNESKPAKAARTDDSAGPSKPEGEPSTKPAVTGDSEEATPDLRTQDSIADTSGLGAGQEPDGKQKSSCTVGENQRAELNRARALAKLSVKKVREVVQQAKADGVQPQLTDLLVEPSWRAAFEPELSKPYFKQLQEFVHKEWNSGTAIYPEQAHVFRAFNSCAVDRVRVVILGQDPYHGPNQAMGLCFSVPEGVKIPSSLQNIFKELESDVGCTRPKHGDLDKWATQGVLLLNTVLTVRANNANSHAKQGWERFTDAAIKCISDRSEGLVFMLWGRPAGEKERLIDGRKHLVLKCAHPSGLSAHRGFFGCKHFSKANAAIEKRGQMPIDWQL